MVNIIGLMTAVAGCTNSHILKITVATLTGHSGMTPQQGKMRKVVIKPDIIVPAAAVVTGLALRAQGLFMHIILLMTATAGLIADRRVHIALMTLLTARLLMPTQQREIRIVMIETAFAPAHRIVALIALLAIFAKVRIVMAVTANTGLRLILGNGMRTMTAGTLQ